MAMTIANNQIIFIMVGNQNRAFKIDSQIQM